MNRAARFFPPTITSSSHLSSVSPFIFSHSLSEPPRVSQPLRQPQAASTSPRRPLRLSPPPPRARCCLLLLSTTTFVRPPCFCLFFTPLMFPCHHRRGLQRRAVGVVPLRLCIVVDASICPHEASKFISSKHFFFDVVFVRLRSLRALQWPWLNPSWAAGRKFTSRERCSI